MMDDVAENSGIASGRTPGDQGPWALDLLFTMGSQENPFDSLSLNFFLC